MRVEGSDGGGCGGDQGRELLGLYKVDCCWEEACWTVDSSERQGGAIAGGLGVEQNLCKFLRMTFYRL